jgi:hypothetical protein
MRIRDFLLSRRYGLFIFITLLLLFAFVVMSLRAKQRKGVELFDAFLMEISFPFQKAATLVIKIVNLGNVQVIDLRQSRRLDKTCGPSKGLENQNRIENLS